MNKLWVKGIPTMQKHTYKEKTELTLLFLKKNRRSPYNKFFDLPVLCKNNGNLIFSHKKA